MTTTGASPRVDVSSMALVPDKTVRGERRTCDVTFSVRVNLQSDEHVRVLGSDVHLGWDHNRGLVLHSIGADGASPEGWEGSLSLPADFMVEYKYIVCNARGFCYSLSSIRRLCTKNKRIIVDDGELSSQREHKKRAIDEDNRCSMYQLQIQLEVDNTHIIKAGQPQLGVVLYDKSLGQVDEVTICTRTSSAVLDSVVLTNEAMHTTAVFHYADASSIKSLSFEFRSSAQSLLGRATTLVSQLSRSHHGVAAVPLVDASFSVVGEVSFRYVHVTPFTHPHIVNAKVPSSRMAFPTPPSSSTLLIGHRGTGADGSRTPVEGKVRSHIRENTVLSFAAAGALGAQLVEFDVHLTSDLVPVIYHDFSTHDHDFHTPIHSLTYEKFSQLGKRKVSKAFSLEDVDTASSPLLPIHDAYPTLRQVLQKVPKHIGFNVEIKYPIDDEAQMYGLHPVDRNTYLDCILWEIFEHAKDRFVVFSSFDPEICLMLAAKQPTYPVFFLTHLGSYLRSDSRSNSVSASISFARSAALDGLVCPAKFLLDNPSVVREMKESGLKVCTWGRENNVPENVHIQKRLGMDGIIADHIGHVAKHWEEKK